MDIEEYRVATEFCERLEEMLDAGDNACISNDRGEYVWAFAKREKDGNFFYLSYDPREHKDGDTVEGYEKLSEALKVYDENCDPSDFEEESLWGKIKKFFKGFFYTYHHIGMDEFIAVEEMRERQKAWREKTS